MYKNFGEFLETLETKVNEKIKTGEMDLWVLTMIMSKLAVLADAAARFEALVETMSVRGFENFDDTTLEMTKETNQKLQDTYTSIIALANGV